MRGVNNFIKMKKRQGYMTVLIWLVTAALMMSVIKYTSLASEVAELANKALVALYSPALDYVQKEGQVQSVCAGEIFIKFFSPSYKCISMYTGEEREKSVSAINVSGCENIVAGVLAADAGVKVNENTKTDKKADEAAKIENKTDEAEEINSKTDEVVRIEYSHSEQTNEKPSVENGMSGVQKTASDSLFNRDDLNRYDFTRGFYIVPSHTDLPESILKPSELLDMNLAVHTDNSKAQILIYHSHSQERFADSTQDLSTTIVGVGDYLTELLEEAGYNVIHDRSVYDLTDGKLDRSNAYVLSAAGVNKILAQNPSIEYVIDLHRDGVNEATHLVTEYNGRNIARVMFFNGISYSNEQGEIDYLENPFRDTNLACSLQAYLLGETYFPGFLRKNYINAYRYNFHLLEKSFLIEAGAQTNTLEEVKNAMEPLAEILDRLFKGEKAY